MANKTLKEISEKMRHLDLCLLSTQSKSGAITSRPMSNNGDVEYDGNSYFFTYEETGLVRDIKGNPISNLNFEGKDKLFVSVEGQAELIKNKATMKKHWIDELKMWFKEGVETQGIILIRVKANKIRYWQKMDMGEVKL